MVFSHPVEFFTHPIEETLFSLCIPGVLSGPGKAFITKKFEILRKKIDILSNNFDILREKIDILSNKFDILRKK